MTDKQIIIDEMMEEIGLDVRKCTYLEIEEDTPNYPEIGGTYTAFNCNYYSRDCKFIDNCIYKKYLRKEQECEGLKQTLTEIKDFFKEECLICKENYINIIGEICKECKYQDILRKINEVE